jgi:hypothetical protein
LDLFIDTDYVFNKVRKKNKHVPIFSLGKIVAEIIPEKNLKICGESVNIKKGINCHTVPFGGHNDLIL